MGFLQSDGNEIVHPARGTLVVRDDQLKRTGFPERLAVASVGYQHLALMEIGIDFSERKDD
jgi:hypothetical protein